MKRIVVDGEHFEVNEQMSSPGVYECRWTSGRNEGYGFTTAAYGGGRMTEVELEEAIRDFLGSVDPDTGYIE